MAPSRADAVNFDQRDDKEWVFIIREALRHEKLQGRFVTFLKTANLNLAERNCVRLFLVLDKLAHCCSRATRYLETMPKTEEIVTKMTAVKKDMKRLVEVITNQYVVIEAQRRVQLSRAVIHQFGLISLQADPAAEGGAPPGPTKVGSFSANDPDSPQFFGSYMPKELQALILEVQHEMVPVCRDFLNRFVADEDNARLVQDAMLSQDLPSLTPNSSIGELGVAKAQEDSFCFLAGDLHVWNRNKILSVILFITGIHPKTAH